VAVVQERDHSDVEQLSEQFFPPGARRSATDYLGGDPGKRAKDPLFDRVVYLKTHVKIHRYDRSRKKFQRSDNYANFLKVAIYGRQSA
jgi:hypothetical protein